MTITVIRCNTCRQELNPYGDRKCVPCGLREENESLKASNEKLLSLAYSIQANLSFALDLRGMALHKQCTQLADDIGEVLDALKAPTGETK